MGGSGATQARGADPCHGRYAQGFAGVEVVARRLFSLDCRLGLSDTIEQSLFRYANERGYREPPKR